MDQTSTKKQRHPNSLKNLESCKFKKGQSGNPLGGQKHNPELRAIRRMTKTEVAEVGAMVLDKNIVGLQEIAKNPTSSALKVWMASVAVKGIQRGDMTALNGLLDRLVGKADQAIQLTGADGGPLDHQITALTYEQKLARLAELQEMDRKAKGEPTHGEG